MNWLRQLWPNLCRWRLVPQPRENNVWAYWNNPTGTSYPWDTCWGRSSARAAACPRRWEKRSRPWWGWRWSSRVSWAASVRRTCRKTPAAQRRKSVANRSSRMSSDLITYLLSFFPWSILNCLLFFSWKTFYWERNIFCVRNQFLILNFDMMEKQFHWLMIINQMNHFITNKNGSSSKGIHEWRNGPKIEIRK